MNSKTPAAKVRFMLDLRKHAFAAISFVTPCAVWLDPVGPSRYSVLKGNIFVGDFRRGRLLGTRPRPRGCGLRLRVPGSRASARRHSALGASAKHAKVIGYDLHRGALLAFAVVPLPRLNASFDKNQRALVQVLLRHLRLLAPHDDAVPLGALLAC